MMEHGFLECERSIFVVCGRQGSGKSTVISTILRTNTLSATSTHFSDLHLLSVVKPHLLITDIVTESSTELQKTLKTLISSTGRLKTLILEVTLTSPDQLSHLDLDQDHDILWYYTRSPYEITSSLTLPPQVTSVSVDISRVKEWQIAAHVLHAYHTTPDTFSALSTFSTANLTVLQNKEVFSILMKYFNGVSTRTLWYVVKMLSHVVEMTIQRISDINENFGKFLDIYTKNVGLMIANQIEQVIRMFSGQFDPSQMFSVFPKLAVQWQQVECNRTSTLATPCQVHLQKLLSECSEHYYKHLDITSRLQKDEDHLVTGALINMLGFEEVDEKVDEVVVPGDDGNIVMSPRFCVLMMQMILRMQVDVPVILWGKEGSGKSTLVQYLKMLYQKSGRQCMIISHDPVLQEVSELARLVQSEASSQSDIVVIVVQLSRREDVKNILKIVTEKTLDGELSSLNVRFVVEFSNESLRACFDSHCLITVEVDHVIVKGLLASIGLPTEIPGLLFPLLNNKSFSYRNVINFTKVHSWIDQVFYSKYRHLLMPTSSNTGHESSLKSGCVLVLATEMVFGTNNDDFLDEVAKHYDISQQLDILLSYTLDNVAKVFFKRYSRHLPIPTDSDDIYRSLLLTLISLETHIPLVLSSQFVQPQLLQSLLTNDGILTDYNCNISVLDNTATPQKVLQCYWACLKESVKSSLCNRGPLQHGVVVCDGYSSLKSSATRRVISELVKCKPVRPLTSDISLIILVQKGTASKELVCCLLGSGVEIEQDNVPDVSYHDTIHSDSKSDITEHSDYSILSVGESTKTDLQETDVSDSFSLFKWIRKRVLPQGEYFQNIASAVLIIRQVLKRAEPDNDLKTQLEGTLDKWGEVLPYLCNLPPSIVATAGDLVKLTKKNFVSHLVEIRIGDLCCKQIISWSNAYSFYTEIKVLAFDTISDNLRTITEHLLWFCEMSSVFCKVKNADLSQHLKVASDITSGKDTSFSNFSSWLDYQQDNRILVYYLTLLIRDKDLILPDLMDIVRGVLTVVGSVEVLCVLLRSLVRKYNIEALDEICDDIGRDLPSNTAIVSALVCVYQEEEEKRMVILETLPNTVTVRNVALVRQSVLYCARLLVDFYDNSNRELDVDVEAYFIAKNSASSFCILKTLISETDNSAVRQYILKHLLDKSGTECLKYCLSALPALQLDTVCSEDMVDLNEVISGYKDMKDKVYPICTLCCDNGNYKPLDKGAACLLYLAQQRSTTVQCNCLITSLPGHMIPVFSIINSRNMGIHSRISVYLASQLTPDGNSFMRYFRDLLTHSDLDNIYWMGMPHDDIFDIINTVRPSEKYAGVEKVYTFYRCGNGHVYSINNCGDPLQKERCPECKEVIGGRDHVVAEQNSKYDNHEKIMIETGYTLKRDEFGPGKTTIRELSQLSTTILWYLTHAILSLRTNRYVPPNDPDLDHKHRLDLAFKEISEKLEVSPDTAIMFLLDVVETLSVYSMDTLLYKSEIVYDSLTPQDILIMQKLEDLKSCRRHWEREFSDVVTSVGEHSEVLRGNLADCGLSKVNQKSYVGKDTKICSTDLTAIKSACYWVTENIVRNPFSKRRTDAARLSKEDEKKNNLLRTFTEEQHKLHLIQHLPFLLTLLRDLQHLLSYKVDSRTLLEPAADHIAGANIKKWYDIWCELNGIWEVSQLNYSVREMKPPDELILFDIAPTSYQSGPGTDLPPNCESGSVTLNMIKYLSLLQNKFAPETSGRSHVPIEELRYLQYNPETVFPFLCNDQTHLSNYLQSHVLSSISRLPTDHKEYLQTLSSRVLYYDQDSQDFENIVKFYNSLENHVDLESLEMELVKGVVGCDLWNLHKSLTGIMAGLGSGDIVLENFLRTLDIAADTVALMSRKDKLFALYKHVNLLCIRSTLFNDSPENYSVFSKLLSSFFTSSFYTKPCPTPELSEEEHNVLLSLLAEYVSLKILHLDIDKPDYLEGWDLGEALELYLEQFDNRDPQMVEFVSDGIKVDHVGYLLNVVLLTGPRSACHSAESLYMLMNMIA